MKIRWMTRWGRKAVAGAFVLFFLASLWPLSSLGSNPAEVEEFLATGYCPGCDLSGAILSGVDAGGSDIGNANLYRVILSLANLSGADLSGTNLTRATLDGANLSNASLDGADLSGATLVLADTTGTLTNASTTCPDGTAGPCNFLEGN